jgi:hypothetical protein
MRLRLSVGSVPPGPLHGLAAGIAVEEIQMRQKFASPFFLAAAAVVASVAFVAIPPSTASALTASPTTKAASSSCTDFAQIRSVSSRMTKQDAYLMAVQSSGLSGQSGKLKLINAENGALRIYSSLYNHAVNSTFVSYPDADVGHAWRNITLSLQLRLHASSLVAEAVAGGGMTSAQRADLQRTSARINGALRAWSLIASALNSTYRSC